MIAPMQRLARGVLALLALMVVLACGAAHAQTGLTPTAPTPTLAPPPPPDEEPPYYDASFVSQSVPASMVAGSTYNVSVTMRNSGTTTWAGAYGDGLGAVNPINNTVWGANRAALGGSVGPNGQATFNFQVTAPATAGTYNFQWQMVADSDLWFGAATPNVAVTVSAPAPVNNATIISQSVPATMTSGQSYPVSVTVQNTGNTTWTAASGYALGSQNPQDNQTWGMGRVSPGTSVAPGQQYTFTFNVTAPAAGSYSMQWKMLKESVEWFGATSSAPVTVNAPAPVNNATIVSQSVPATMTSGQSYPVLVTVQNTGNTTWSAGAAYPLGTVNPENNLTWGLSRVPLNTSVAPGQQYMFSFNVTAPAAGSYSMQWRMLKEGVGWFGQTMIAPVTVNAPAPVNNAIVVSQSVPAAMSSGQSYPVAVTVQNTGTTTWTTAYALGSQNPQDNQAWGTARIFVGAPVAPGQQYTFSFNVTAPAAGNYNMQWKVLSSVEWFGQTMTAPVTVAAPVPVDVATYVHTDGLGSPVARSDAAGNLVSRTRYEPYGGTASGETPTIGFTGHVNDADTGLVYMQQRYYDPVAGRFLSIDPVTTDANTGGSFNRYAYANNGPYKYIDPDGRDAEKPKPEPKPKAEPKTDRRKSSSTLRRLWEEFTGQNWPKDPATGRNQDVSHKEPVADGGKPNDPRNIEPKPHAEHMQEHMEKGDFKRWGARSGAGKIPATPGGLPAGVPSTAPVVEPVVSPVPMVPGEIIIEPPILELPIFVP